VNIAAKTDPLLIQIEPANRLLTAAEFQKLADVPPPRSSGSPTSATGTPAGPTKTQ
jgi:hypothetical protein